MAVSIEMEYEGALECRAVHGPSGVALTTDAPTDNGGKGSQFSPTDLVATGLGSCMLTIMGIAAARYGLDIKGTRARVLKEMVAAPMRRIGALRVTITFPPGLRLSEEDRRFLIRAAEDCPVRQSLHPEVAVHIEFVYPD